MTEITFNMNMGRLFREGVENRNRAMKMGIRKEEKTVPIMRILSNG